MSILESKLKEYFADLALIQEALNEAEGVEDMPPAPEAPQAPAPVAETPPAQAPRIGPDTGLSDAAHNSVLAIAQHHINRKTNKERAAREQGDPTAVTGEPYLPELHKGELRGHEDTVARELIGTLDKPGPVAKMAKSLGKRFNMDAEEIMSQFIGGGATERAKSLPILSLIKQHGHEILTNPEAVTPQSWKAKLRVAMQRTAMNSVKSRKRKRETPLEGSVPGEASSPYSAPDERSEIKPGAQSAGQREMGTFRSVAYNEDQKKLADLISKYVDAQRKTHGEKGNAGGIHPDILHNILTHHFFQDYGPNELVDKFGHHIPSKSANEDPVKARTSKGKVMAKRLSDFKDSVLAPQFEKPRTRAPVPSVAPAQPQATQTPAPAPTEEPEPDNSKEIDAAKQVLMQPMPDPNSNPQGYQAFKNAAASWRKLTKQYKLPLELMPKKKPVVPAPQDPNAEPPHPEPPTIEMHNEPRTPGLENVNITARLFGNGYASVLESVSLTGSLIRRRG